jgi:hypothetical protein
MCTNRIICIVDDDADITLLIHGILISITGITVLNFTDPILSIYSNCSTNFLKHSEGLIVKPASSHGAKLSIPTCIYYESVSKG